MGKLSMIYTDPVLSCFHVCPNSSNTVNNKFWRRCSRRFKRLRLSMCGIYRDVLSNVRAASKLPRKNNMATKPVVMTSASLICCCGSSVWPIVFKISALKQYTARILSSMGSLVFQERSGSPPLTLEDEPHGCQEVATWVKLSSEFLL